jgi:hypothetical protein
MLSSPSSRTVALAWAASWRTSPFFFNPYAYVEISSIYKWTPFYTKAVTLPSCPTITTLLHEFLHG